MEKLIIEPNTPKGKIQLESIGWAQRQMNEVLRQFFNNFTEFKLLKGLQLEFKLRLDLKLDQEIKVDVLDLSVKTEKEFDDAVKLLREKLFKNKDLAVDSKK